jgi:hypothetical protein
MLELREQMESIGGQKKILILSGEEGIEGKKVVQD